ncbi:hypothetical protein V1289_007395 [Bradyrhizobium sp. AZCC 2289]
MPLGQRIWRMRTQPNGSVSALVSGELLRPTISFTTDAKSFFGMV